VADGLAISLYHLLCALPHTSLALHFFHLLSVALVPFSLLVAPLACSNEKVANRNVSVRVWHGATENAHTTMDKFQTFAAYVYM
jgi:hypothetical protein